MNQAKKHDNACNRANCPCMEGCPLGSALDKIGGKWKLRILCALLQDGTTRYNALKRKIDGITNTMLASSLKELEQDGLLLRRQYAEVPVRVEYTASEAGRQLVPILEQLARWELTLRKQQSTEHTEKSGSCLP